MYRKRINLLLWLFLLGIFFLPFIFWPWARIPYEIPKVWFFQKWVEGLGFLAVLGMLGDRKDQEEQGGGGRKPLLTLLVLCFVLISVLSSIFGADFPKSLSGNYYRGDGLITLFHLFGLFLLVILFWEETWEKPTVLAISAGSLLVSFWTILVGTLGRPGTLRILGGSMFGNAVGATFGNPNFLAGYLLVSLPFTIYWTRRSSGTRWAKGARWILPMIQLLAIGLTLSRAAILGVFVFGIMLMWGKAGKRERLGILGIVGVLGLVGILGLKKELRVTEGMYFFPESRGRIIVRGITAFTQKPLLGWGVANFDYAFESVDWPIKVDQDVYVDKAHSNFLEVLVTTGIFGLLSYLGIVLGILKRLRRLREGRNEWEKVLIMVFLLFLFHSQTNVISINEEIVFWLIGGIAVASR